MFQICQLIDVTTINISLTVQLKQHKSDKNNLFIHILHSLELKRNPLISCVYEICQNNSNKSSIWRPFVCYLFWHFKTTGRIHCVNNFLSWCLCILNNVLTGRVCAQIEWTGTDWFAQRFEDPTVLFTRRMCHCQFKLQV